MGTEVKWLEPQILLFKLHPPFNKQDLNRALNESIEMVNAVPNQIVGTVLDVKGIMHIPPGAIQYGMRLVKRKPTNAGPVVLVQAHPVVKGFCQMVKMVNPNIGKLIHFADNHTAGVAILQRTMKMAR